MKRKEIFVETRTNEAGANEHVRIVFGPHHFAEVAVEDDGAVTFVLGATHHGFRADASAVNGELEKIIGEVCVAHPQNLVD